MINKNIAFKTCTTFLVAFSFLQSNFAMAQQRKSTFWRDAAIIGGATAAGYIIYKAGQRNQERENQRQWDEYYEQEERQKAYKSRIEFENESLRKTMKDNQVAEANRRFYLEYFDTWSKLKTQDAQEINEAQRKLNATKINSLESESAQWICKSLCINEVDVSDKYPNFASVDLKLYKANVTTVTSNGDSIVHAFESLQSKCEQKGTGFFMISGAFTNTNKQTGVTRIGYTGNVAGQACMPTKALNLVELSQKAGTQPNPTNPLQQMRSKVLDVKVIAEPGENISDLFLHEAALAANQYNLTDLQKKLKDELAQAEQPQQNLNDFQLAIDKQTQEYVIFNPKDKSIERQVMRVKIIVDNKTQKPKYYVTAQSGFRVQHTCGEEAHRVEIKLVLEETKAPKNADVLSENWKRLYLNLNKAVIDNYCTETGGL